VPPFGHWASYAVARVDTLGPCAECSVRKTSAPPLPLRLHITGAPAVACMAVAAARARFARYHGRDEAHWHPLSGEGMLAQAPDWRFFNELKRELSRRDCVRDSGWRSET
jgi:hypothetical protein